MTSASWSAVAEGQYERIVGYFIAKKYVDYKIHVLRGAAYRSAQSVGCRPRWPLASAKFEPTRDATRSRQPPSECAAGARTWGRTATVGFGFNFERPYCSHESIQCRVKPLLGGSDEQAIYDLQFAYIPWFQAGQELRIYTGNSRGHLPRGSGAKLLPSSATSVATRVFSAAHQMLATMRAHGASQRWRCPSQLLLYRLSRPLL